MLSIGKVQRGESGRQYYLDLHEEDYYNRRGSGEPPGQWEGRLAASFGLRGLVEEEDFCNLFNAESPADGERLRQRRPNERPAFDLTYSAPKDVSTVYAFAGPELKREMDAAMYGAVLASFGYVEDEACTTRLAWIPIRGIHLRVRLPVVWRSSVVRRSLYTTRLSQPKIRRTGLSPSHGMRTLVLSKPAATNNGLWARFWKRTQIASASMSMRAVASTKSRNRWRDLTVS